MLSKSLRGLVSALLLIGTPLSVEAVELRPDYPETYTVVKGDTLWDISARFLKDPWNWQDIWQINPQIDNPHLIYPGDLLALIFVDGKPQIRRIENARKTVKIVSGGTTKLSPSLREIRVDRAVNALPYEVVQQFLTKTRMVLSKLELDQAPYIVDSRENHLISGPGHNIYVRAIMDDNNKDFNVYRAGGAYRDPDTNEILGYEAVFLGKATLNSTGDPARLTLQKTRREILLGDRLIPVTESDAGRHFIPHVPSGRTDGKIIAVVDGVSQIGQFQTVVLNLGSKDDIEPGHVLSVFKAGQRIRDSIKRGPDEFVQLPDEAAGSLMVFRTFEKLSYALVMNASSVINLKDRVSNPR